MRRGLPDVPSRLPVWHFWRTLHLIWPTISYFMISLFIENWKSLTGALHGFKVSTELQNYTTFSYLHFWGDRIKRHAVLQLTSRQYLYPFPANQQRVSGSCRPIRTFVWLLHQSEAVLEKSSNRIAVYFQSTNESKVLKCLGQLQVRIFSCLTVSHTAVCLRWWREKKSEELTALKKRIFDRVSTDWISLCR